MVYINTDISVPQLIERLRGMGGTVEDKVDVLKVFGNRKDLLFVIDFMYNGDATRKLIASIPEYTPSTKPYGVNFLTLNTALNRVHAALALLGSEHFTQEKFDKLLRLVLESVSADEASLLVNLLQGHKIRGGVKEAFKVVFPQFFRSNED